MTGYEKQNWDVACKIGDGMLALVRQIAAALNERDAESEKLRTALGAARTALLNIEKRCEEGRAALTQLAEAK